MKIKIIKTKIKKDILQKKNIKIIKINVKNIPSKTKNKYIRKMINKKMSKIINCKIILNLKMLLALL